MLHGVFSTASQLRLGTAAWCFLVLTYGMSWAVDVPAALAARQVIKLHVPQGLQTSAQLAPALAALIVAGYFGGRRGLMSLAASVFRGRAPLRWYAFALLLPPGTGAAVVLVFRLTGHALHNTGPWYELPLLTAALTVFSIGEELGWRGFFLPTLMVRQSLFAAAAWTALVWGLWHLPVYLALDGEGESTGLLYFLFLVGIFPVSAFFTLLYARTRSVLLCMLLHGSLNAAVAHWFGPLPRGELFPVVLWVTVLWAVAVPVGFALPQARPQPNEMAGRANNEV